MRRIRQWAFNVPARLSLLCGLLTVVAVGCTRDMGAPQPATASLPIQPADLRGFLGRVVTVEGEAQNWNVGPAVDTGTALLGIEGLNEWPERLQGHRVRVTGTLVERHDLPVFVQREGEPSIAGIPVPEGTDLHEASRRS